jgi:DNA-binding NarL/FixJ family response regulator
LNLRRAVLMDPYPLWLDAVQDVLDRSSVEVIGRCTSDSEAVELVREHQPELLVTELDGIVVDDYLRRALAAGPSTRVIVLTEVEDENVVAAALRAGVNAYVVKTALPDVFEAALGPTFAHSVFLPASNGNGVPKPSQAARDPEVPLTRREAEILQRVAQGAANAEVAQDLWVTEQTVKFHLSNIYKKLGVANRTEAGFWAERQGLLGESASAT